MKKGSLTVLLVDDSPSDRNLFRLILQEIDPNIHYISVNGGDKAIEWLHDTVTLPDYIFLDINMPGMNGIECLEKIKKDETFCHIPVIMYSTSDGKTYEDAARELGAERYLRKSPDFYKSIHEIGSIILDVDHEQKKKK